MIYIRSISTSIQKKILCVLYISGVFIASATPVLAEKFPEEKTREFIEECVRSFRSQSYYNISIMMDDFMGGIPRDEGISLLDIALAELAISRGNSYPYLRAPNKVMPMATAGAGVVFSIPVVENNMRQIFAVNRSLPEGPLNCSMVIIYSGDDWQSDIFSRMWPVVLSIFPDDEIRVGKFGLSHDTTRAWKRTHETHNITCLGVPCNIHGSGLASGEGQAAFFLSIELYWK
ncbi:MAG: hypothetical protein CMF72_12175 [Mameliella sp.]|nr:hypothetical protein [Mameliella sp.]